MLHFLESNKLLSNYQFGFILNQNTELALTHFKDYIQKSINDGKLTGSIFIDLSNAYAMQILENLSSTGVKRSRVRTFLELPF